MNKRKLNWQQVNTLLKRQFTRILFFVIGAFAFVIMIGATKVKVNNQHSDGTGDYYLLIKDFDIGDPYPCGPRLGISVEDSLFIFSMMSCYNATWLAGDVDYPEDGIGINNKMESPPDLDAYSYRQAFNRINTLNIGTYRISNGQRLGIAANEARQNYPDNTFDISLNGEAETAFNPENLFYEMLISIQTLSKKNAELEFRLNQLEQTKGIDHTGTSKSSIKILNNPIHSNSLDLEYSIDHATENACISIVSMSGVKLKEFGLNQRGEGLQSFSIDLPNGIYLCVLQTDGKIQTSQKFIVE